MNDRNDIDSILDSMFRGGVLNVKSPAAKEAEKSLEAVQKAQQDMSQSLRIMREENVPKSREKFQECHALFSLGLIAGVLCFLLCLMSGAPICSRVQFMYVRVQSV